MLRGKRKQYCCFLLILYLTISCICFDNFKTDRFLRPFSEASNSQLLSLTYESMSEDLCTAEMLGNGQFYLCNQVVFPENPKLQTTGALPCSAKLQDTSISCSFSSVTSVVLFIDNTDVTEVIHFIHNQDGKKRI